ncbi:hypothetical protein [Flavobacterium enshiense]|nr:hypothetical protein [Flavobacterium enshiense]UOK41839.1 hypothetical protein LZF87_11030 [Flavobacterium enshiense]
MNDLQFETRSFLLCFHGKIIIKTKFMIIQNKRLLEIVLVVAILLFIPFIAMQFTDEVNWSLFDFIVAGVLLLSTGLMCELVIRKVSKTEHKVTLCAALLVVLALIWIELAIGIFGTPLAGL